MTLRDLRAEFEAETIGVQWLEEVRSMCQRIVVSYSVETYAHGVSWDSELDDLVQDVVTERLLGERQAHYLMAASSTLPDFRRLLGRQIRLTLAHRRRRTVLDQLLARARLILSSEPFQKVQSNPDAWTLAAAQVTDRAATPSELRFAAERVRLIPVVRGRGLKRASTVYTTANLENLLRLVVESLATPLRISDLDRILELLLTPFLPSILDREGSPQGDPSSALTPDEEHELNVAVRTMLAGLDAQDRLLLAAKLSGVSDADVAAALQVSRPTAAHRKQVLLERLEPLLGALPDPLRTIAVDRLSADLAGVWPPALQTP